MKLRRVYEGSKGTSRQNGLSTITKVEALTRLC